MDKEIAILCLVVLVCVVPTAIHVRNDRKGDNKKGNDVIVLTCLAFLLAALMKLFLKYDPHRTLALMGGIHGGFFDYWINLALYKNQVIADRRWFQYLGKSAKLDRWKWWAKIGKWWRGVIRAVVFLIGLSIFIWT